MNPKLKIELKSVIEELNWEDFDENGTSIEKEIKQNGKTYWFVAKIKEKGWLTSASLIEDEKEVELIEDEEFIELSQITELHYVDCLSFYLDEVEHYNDLRAL